MVCVLLLAEYVGELADDVQVLGADGVELGAGRQFEEIEANWQDRLKEGLKLLFSHVDSAADSADGCCLHERSGVVAAEDLDEARNCS